MRIKTKLKMERPSALLERSESLDLQGGAVYCILFRDALELLELAGYFLFEKREPLCFSNLHLLYVGCATKGFGSRLRCHFGNNSQLSSLRLTLACFLKDGLELVPRVIGDRYRCNFGETEKRLSKWLNENTLVAYHFADDPSALEKRLISELAPPLNITLQRTQPFAKHLMTIRHTFSRDPRLPRVPAGVVRRAAFEKCAGLHPEGLSQLYEECDAGIALSSFERAEVAKIDFSSASEFIT